MKERKTTRKHLRFDLFNLQETKLPVRLINTTNDRRLVKGHEITLRVEKEIEDASSELDIGGKSSLDRKIRNIEVRLIIKDPLNHSASVGRGIQSLEDPRCQTDT
ncbi:UNVERIFIED_CONTAM: hypothetical protein NCL1_09648 [Trichonephila clavipes]